MPHAVMRSPPDCTSPTGSDTRHSLVISDPGGGVLRSNAIAGVSPTSVSSDMCGRSWLCHLTNRAAGSVSMCGGLTGHMPEARPRHGTGGDCAALPRAPAPACRWSGDGPPWPAYAVCPSRSGASQTLKPPWRFFRIRWHKTGCRGRTVWTLACRVWIWSVQHLDGVLAGGRVKHAPLYNEAGRVVQI